MRKPKDIETKKLLFVLPMWQWDELERITKDDVSKEIRRAIKSWIEAHKLLNVSNIPILNSNNKESR